MKYGKAITLLLVVLSGLSLAPRLLGQAVTGTLLGTISDQTGAVIQNAKVTITEVKTGVSYNKQTNASGNYEFPDIPPGIYDVKVEEAGFKAAQTHAVDVVVNSSVRVDVSLTMGSSSQQVVVRAQGTALQTDRADVTANLDAKQVLDLPNAGESQNFQSLESLVPGVSAAFHDQGPAFDAQESEGFEVNGQSQFANNLQFEGIDDNERTGLLQVYLPAAQAIQSVNISTSNYAPEFGRAGGAVTNVTLKSGTNNLHGSLYEYNEVSTLEAKDYFDTTTPKPTLTNNYYGATLGGPIVPNHTFFFADVLRYDNYNGNFNLVTVPTAAFRAGNLSASTTPIYDPSTGTAAGSGRTQFSSNGVANVIPTNRLDPIAQRILALVPLPNVPGAGVTNNYSNVTGFGKNSTQFDVKVDQNLRSSDRLTYRYSLQKVITNVGPLFGLAGGDTGSGLEGTGSQTSYNTALEYVRVFSPSLLMELRGGVNHYDNINRQSDYGLDSSSALGIPGVNVNPMTSGLVAVNVTDYSEPLVGYAPTIPWQKSESNIDIVNNWTKIAGNHSFKFGAEVRRIRNDVTQGYTFSPRGEYDYAEGQTAELKGTKSSATSYANDFASFLLDVPNEVGRDVNIGDNSWRQTLYFAFVQDTWQASRRLTLMYGTRWEFYPPSTPAKTGGFSQYDPATNSLDVAGYGSIPRNLGLQVNYLDFAPRAGFAYRALDSTVVRGGFGISYEPFPDLNYAYNAPVEQNDAYNPINAYQPALLPNGAPATLGAGFPTPSVLTVPSSGIIPNAQVNSVYYVVNPHYRDPYVMSYNLTVEQELQHHLVASVAYVGNEGREIPVGYNLNAGFVPGAGAAGQPEYATFGRTAATDLLGKGTNSDYNSLQAQLRRRWSQGLVLTAAYTYQKAMGYVSSTNGLGYYTFYVEPQRNYARLSWDQRQAFTQSALYTLPFGKNRQFLHSGIAAALLENWEIGDIFSLRSGTPLTFTASATSYNAPGNTVVANETGPFKKLKGVGTAHLWFDPTIFSSPTGTANGNTGQNIYSGPGQLTFDASVQREFPITQRIRFKFLANGFNALNHPTFSNPTTALTSASFGYITKGGNSPRQLQFAGVILF
jgi:Carboxypeptidase regulatory-like domain